MANQDISPAAAEHPKKKSKTGLILIAIAVGSVIFVVILGLSIPSPYQKSSDPEKIREVLGRMTDIEVPVGLVPSSTGSHSRTGLEAVSFKSPTDNSYLNLSTGPMERLEHRSTIQDAYDRGVTVGGGTPVRPTESNTIRLSVRGRPAEFLLKRYANFELVSGYFQGKNHAVTLEARLDYTTFPPGSARQLVKTIDVIASRKAGL